MDQNKTNVPHMIRVPKSCQNLWNLRTHLTGNLVHGRGNHGYFDFLQWPHDCNLTITTMLQTLLQLGQLLRIWDEKTKTIVHLPTKACDDNVLTCSSLKKPSRQSRIPKPIPKQNVSSNVQTNQR